MAKISISGPLKWSPEMRFTVSGRALCTFTVLTPDGEVSCVAWESVGEQICDDDSYFTDSAMISVRGYFKDRKWTDRNGDSRITREFNVTDLLGARLDLSGLDPGNFADIGDHLWVMGVDPGVTTGVCLFAIPYLSIFGEPQAKGGFLVQRWWELNGTLRDQVQNICKIAMRVSSTRRHRPLIVCEDFDIGGNRLQGAASEAEVVSPVRIGAALEYAVQMGSAGDALLLFQGRSLAMSDATDDRLKTWNLYDSHSGPHKRDATRHTITCIRRMKNFTLDPVLMGRLKA